MHARTMMSSPPIVVTSETGVADIIALILDRRISAVPVVDAAGSLVGVVSASDLMFREELGTAHKPDNWFIQKMYPRAAASAYAKSRGTRAEHVMSRALATVTPDADLNEIVGKMSNRGIQRVVVVEDGKPVGIISRRDVLRAILDQQTAARTTGSDEAIQQAILDELQGQHWYAPSRFHIAVVDGVATIDGVVYSRDERSALVLAAERASGVRSVVDRTVAEFG